MGHDLVIDVQYAPQHFKKIYGNRNVSSFKDVYAEILYDETLTHLEKNGIKFYYFDTPSASFSKNLDNFEKLILKGQLSEKERINKVLYTDLLVKQCVDSGEYNNIKMVNNGKYNVLKDIDGKFINIRFGQRIVPEAKSNYHKNIYMFGSCAVCGYRSPDEYTVPNFLQKLLNCDNQKCMVKNCGFWGADIINAFEYILDTNFKFEDVVIVFTNSDEIANKVFNKHKSNCSKTSFLFDRPHNYGYWFIDEKSHLNHIGNKVIANYIYEVIKPDLSKQAVTTVTLNKSQPKPQNAIEKTVKYQFENEADTFLDDNPDFKKYLDGLKAINAKQKAAKKVGSIVMNCNPFTLGHRYLIEQTAKQVDHLYIFVVEEDKSVFPFKERLELVKKGTEDLGDKVTILPSGKWIISLLTFPEYFNKDDLQGAAIDPSKDINLFGKYIAPTLGINMRFVGEEPFDKVTRQYNETMRNILPSFGVNFQEIPRNATDGKDDVISATKVRNALKAGDFEALKKYVPKTTLNYLKENYEQIVAKINSKYKK